MDISSCSTQLLQIMHQLLNYDLSYKSVPNMCDNTSAISLLKYVVHHSKAKHIDIKYHFIRDHVESEYFILTIVDSENYFADMFIKPLLDKRFFFLINKLGITNI